MTRLARTFMVAALVSAALNVCWMPASVCAAPQKRAAAPSCHHQKQDAPAPAKSCCGGSGMALSQAGLNAAPVLETAFFVVAVVSAEADTETSVSWTPAASDLSPPEAAPPEPSLGRAPPVLA